MELRHILQGSDCTELSERMRICVQLKPHRFRSIAAGPDAGEGKEESGVVDEEKLSVFKQFIETLDIDDPDQCLQLFRSNTMVGWMIFLGLIGGAAWQVAKPLL